MNILLDECLDWRLKRDLPGHTVRTVGEMGWSGIKNGELMARAAGQFEVFITGDQNLSFQQHTVNLPFAVVVLHGESIRLVHTRPLMPQVLALLPTVQPGVVVTVTL